MLDAIAGWPGADLLRQSNYAYPLASACHIIAIGLLIGPILALDARLLGACRAVPLQVIGPYLAGVARAGVILAIVTGLLIFTVRPTDYLNNAAFFLKLGLLVLACVNAELINRSAAWRTAIEGQPVGVRLRMQAGASAVLWLSVVVVGRWIAFV